MDRSRSTTEQNDKKKLIKWSKEMFVLRNLLATINPSLISDFTLAR